MRKDSGAMLSIAIIAIASLLALVFYKATRLVYFLSAARQCGLPYVVSPLLETEKLSLLLTPILRRVYHKHLLKDDGWPKWCRFIIKDWSWEDKRRAHDEYGDVFLVVSPEGIICYSADAALNWDVLNRRHEFLKPRDKYSKSSGSISGGHVLIFLERYWNPTVQMSQPPKEALTASMCA